MNEIAELGRKIIQKKKELKKLEKQWKKAEKKIPSEMNVIFVSMESCGISWIIRELSKYHMKIYGVPIVFTPKNAEISHLDAKENYTPLPKRWNNVYEINPQELLDKVDPEGKSYDRVILVHRDIKTLKAVYTIRMAKENLHIDHINKILKKSEEIHKDVYDNEIDDPRFFQMDLWEANQYTGAVFNDLMDFLGFPKEIRPPVVRVKTLSFLALIEAYSSVWDKNYQLMGKLGRIEGLFKLSYDGLLEYIAKEVIDNPDSKVIEVEYK